MHGGIIVFDLTKKRTLEDSLNFLDEFKARNEKPFPVFLIGNKLDLCNSNPEKREVSQVDAEAFASKNNLIYREFSCIDDDPLEIFTKMTYGKLKCTLH